MSSLRFLPLVVLAVLTGSPAFIAFGQDSQYWFIQPDGESSLLGASVTASIKDNTAIYYNPGALAQVRNTNLSFNANVYFLNTYFIENGAGNGINLSRQTVDALPLLFSGNIAFKKAKRWTFSYLYMNRHKSKRRLEASNEAYYDITDSIPGHEFYTASYTSDIDMKEDWVGFGVAYKLNEHIGIGFSPIFTFYNNRFLELTDASLFGVFSDSNNVLLASSTIQKNAHITAIGVLFNVGMDFRYGKNLFGFSVLSPRVSFDLWSLSSSKRNEAHVAFGTGSKPYKYISDQSNVPTEYKSPWEINLGYARLWDNQQLSIRVAVYSNINSYDMLRPDNNQEPVFSGPDPEIPGPTVPRMRNNAVVNVGVGYQRKLLEKLTLLTGFHTDFSYIKDGDLADNNFVPAQTFWNIYHFSGGVFWENSWVKLNLGLSYAFSHKKNLKQYVNLTDPTIEGGLLGTRTNTAKVIYNQYRIFLGVTFKFLSKQEG